MFYDIEQKTVQIRHIAFFFALVSVFLGSIFIASLNTGPVILGTEMNANGLVEYLCLGNGCENFTSMRWVD